MHARYVIVILERYTKWVSESAAWRRQNVRGAIVHACWKFQRSSSRNKKVTLEIRDLYLDSLKSDFHDVIAAS